MLPLFTVPPWILLCVLVAIFAWYRGRSALGFFFLSFVLSPVVGFIVAVVLKPRYDKIEARYERARARRERAAAAVGKRKCPWCAEYIKREARVCRFCNHALGP